MYHWPNKEHIAAGVSCPLKAMKVTQYSEDQVTYMSDQLGLHKISNPDPENVAVSLHRKTLFIYAAYTLTMVLQSTLHPTLLITAVTCLMRGRENNALSSVRSSLNTPRSFDRI